MPEYAGKIDNVQPLRFDELVGGVTDDIRSAYQKRQTEKAELDQMYSSADQAAREVEQFENPTLNTVVSSAVNDIRDNYYNLNKELKAGRLKPAEYRVRFNNTQSALSMFANTAKTFDETMKNFLTRQQPVDGKIPGSGFEQYLSGVFADMADLGNKRVNIDPKTGNLMLTQYDQDGLVIGATDVTKINNPGNMIDNRYDLNANINTSTDSWEPFKKGANIGMGRVHTIESVRENTAYQTAVDAKVQEVLSNNRYTASVLKDNGSGEYDFYRRKSEMDSAIEAEVATQRRIAKAAGKELSKAEIDEVEKLKRDRMILVTRDETGTMQPRPSEAQYKAARERVVAEIEIQLGYTDTTTAGRNPVTDTESKHQKKLDGSLYGRLERAWNKGETSAFNALSGDDTLFEWVKGGLQEYKIKRVADKKNKLSGEVTYKTERIPQGSPIKHLDDMSSYFYGETDAKGQAGGRYDLKIDKAAYKSLGANEPTAEELINKYK